MAVTLFTSGTGNGGAAFTVTTEHSLASCNVAGAFSFEIDTSLMAVGDAIEIRAYTIMLTGGTKRLTFVAMYAGAQSTLDVSKVSIPVVNDLTDANSVEFSVKQTIGTGRAMPWKVTRSN